MHVECTYDCGIPTGQKNWLWRGDNLAMKSGHQRFPVFLFSSATFVVCSSAKRLCQSKTNVRLTHSFFEVVFIKLIVSGGVFPTSWQNFMTALFMFFMLSQSLPLTCYLEYLTADWCHIFKCRRGKMFWRFGEVSQVFNMNKLIILKKKRYKGLPFQPVRRVCVTVLLQIPISTNIIMQNSSQLQILKDIKMPFIFIYNSSII